MGISLAWRRGSSHHTIISSSYMGARTGKQGVTADATWSGRHFSRI